MDRPCLHRPTYRCTNHDNIHVRGFTDEGTITTPFDNTVPGAMMVAEALFLLWIGWSRCGLATSDNAVSTFSFLMLLYFAVFSVVSRGSAAGFGRRCPARPLWQLSWRMRSSAPS